MMRIMHIPFNKINRERTMKIQATVIALVCISQFAHAAKTDHYNSLQTITYSGTSDSFQQNVRAIIRSTTFNEDDTLKYRMAFEGGITYPSESQPTIAQSEEVIVIQNSSGKLDTAQPSIARTIAIINEGVDWATSNSLPENKQLRIPIDLGNGVTSYSLMTFDSEPVKIGASNDTRLVTIRTAPRRISGRSGVFTIQYQSIFIYSPKEDQLYQSTSVFTAKNGGEQLRIEEQTFLTSENGGAPRYPLVSYENRLGTFMDRAPDSEMTNPPPPWVIEAITARESLYCAGKAIVYQKTNWVFVSAFIANTTYAMMNYAWNAVAGETLVASVSKSNPEIGARLGHIDIETVSCISNTSIEASQLQLGSTVLSESAALGAALVKITPDAKPTPPSPAPAPIAAAGMDWTTTALIIGGGAGVAIAAGGSSGGGGSACAGNGLVDSYTATVSSPCMGISIPTVDISFALNLLSNCSLTGTADVYGTSLSTTTTTWSYNDSAGTLTIGSYTGAVAEGALTFTTPLEQIFPAVAAQIEAAVDLLLPAEIQDIIDNCGSVSAYVADLQMTWVR
jgi:hypothetical protein